MTTKLIKYIFTLLFSAYFLLAGAGYNVVNYCCNACATEGIEAVATSSCFGVHHHTVTAKSTLHDDLACENVSHQPENCHLLRLNTDIPSIQVNDQNLVKQIPILDLFKPDVLFEYKNTDFFSHNNIPPPDIDVLKTGRSILALNAVLLI